jgi:hypothetical protein
MSKIQEILVHGYHGTSVENAESISSEGFRVSRNDYDWLGKGIYFWQDAPERALSWAQQQHQNPAVKGKFLLMTNVPLNKKAIDRYLSELKVENVIDFLKENNFEKIRYSCLQETEDKLVNLMVDCSVFEFKAQIIENDRQSCFYIHILEIIEKGRGDELYSLFANFIQNSINNDEYNRVVGLLCTRDGDEHNISRERYNLAPVTASNLKKPPFELLFRENTKSDRDRPVFSVNGKINRHEKVILIDEMITTGENIKRAIDYLRNREDVKIEEVFILISRTSEEKLSHIRQSLSDDFGVNLHCILSIEKLLNTLRQRKDINPEEFDRVIEEITN